MIVAVWIIAAMEVLRNIILIAQTFSNKADREELKAGWKQTDKFFMDLAKAVKESED